MQNVTICMLIPENDSVMLSSYFNFKFLCQVIFLNKEPEQQNGQQKVPEIKKKMIPITSKLQSNYTLPWFLDIR